MLFYLTSKDKADLLDFVETREGFGYVPKKMTGRFSLMQFVVRDMRNYAHNKFFVIDRTAVMEDNGGFIEAVRSFQTMYAARIIVICEGYGEQDPFVLQLVSTGVTDIVTATEITGMQAEILECLSTEGKIRFQVPAREQPDPTKSLESGEDEEVKQYIFTARNVRVAVAGLQRRSGTTVTASNLAHWIQAHGGTACYVERNMSKHLSYMLQLYGEPSGNEYRIGNVDYYLTDELDRPYNFILYDCGELGNPPQPTFLQADVRVVCGPAMPYDIERLRQAIGRCGESPVHVIGLFVSEDLQPLISGANPLGRELLWAEPSHIWFSNTANHKLNRNLVAVYIADT